MIARPLAVAAVGLVVAGAGCSHRKPGACTVTCADDSLCPEGSGCGSDGFCHLAGDVTPCSSIIDPADGGPRPDGGGSVDDAAPGRPDAEPPPDADPCAGVPNRAAASDVQDHFIPDGDLQGIDLTLSIDRDCVTVETVEVWVEILHEYRGDVELVLTSPGGESRLLLASSDDSRENIFASFETAAFAGQAASGDWVLNVSDVLADFYGWVDYWSIGINRAAP
ncbi:MAG TPA: proprotein convertase P-domain-containing protein [Kofleriaceae bacterium]|nr:proprotein convertase P-domain-containing protein [Kofleriaceae bacterium]